MAGNGFQHLYFARSILRLLNWAADNKSNIFFFFSVYTKVKVQKATRITFKSLSNHSSLYFFGGSETGVIALMCFESIFGYEAFLLPPTPVLMQRLAGSFIFQFVARGK